MKRRSKHAASGEWFTRTAEQKRPLQDTLKEHLAEVGEEVKGLGVDVDTGNENVSSP